MIGKYHFSHPILPFVILILLTVLYLSNTTETPREQIQSMGGDVQISETRAEHILYGNETGGGHMHGASVPCKSEFPASWNVDKILDTTRRVAANDNTGWEQQNNGYYVGEEMVEGVNVRVVLSPDRRNVITSYPTNVARNPCPSKRSANDNR